MSNLRFEQEEEFGRPKSRSGDWTDRLIKWGIVSTRTQGQYLLIGLVVALLIIAVLVYRSGSGGEGPPMLP